MRPFKHSGTLIQHSEARVLEQVDHDGRMEGMIPCLLALCSAVSLQAPAQQSRSQGSVKQARSFALPRGRLVGRARTHDGKPWKNAIVTLLSRPFPASEQIGKSDLLCVRSDERGAFRAQLILGRAYSVWAHSAAVNGEYTASKVHEGVLAGLPVRVVELPDKRLQLRVAFRGLSRWDKHGPLRVQAVSRSENVHVVPMEVDTAGTVLFPPLPHTRTALEIYDKNGMFLGSRTPDLLKETRLRHAKSSITKGRTDYGAKMESIELSAPYAVVIRVEATALGKRAEPGVAVAGAEVFCRVRRNWNPVGRTNAKGLLRFNRVLIKRRGRFFGPLFHGPFEQQYLLVSAPGHSRRLVQCVSVKVDESLDPMRTKEDLLARLRIRTPTTLSGRIFSKGTSPVPGLPILLLGSYPTGLSGGYINSPTLQPTVFHTDMAGKVDIPDLESHRRGELQFCMVLTGESMKHAPGFPDHPISPLVLLRAEQATPFQLDVGNVDINDLHPVSIRVKKPEGSPASGPRLRVGLTEGRSVHMPLELYGDARGKLRILVQSGARLSLAAAHNGSFMFKRVDLSQVRKTERISIIDLVLPETTRLSGTFKYSNGRPATGLEVNLRLDSNASKSEAAHSMMFYALHKQVTTVDAQGQFSFNVRKNTRFIIRTRPNTGSQRVSVAGDPVTGIEFELEKR